MNRAQGRIQAAPVGEKKSSMYSEKRPTLPTSLKARTVTKSTQSETPLKPAVLTTSIASEYYISFLFRQAAS
ncbi:MAG: hypothetical protein GYB18_14830 [Oceanospirillales bacterium]|nr:hypothetical protein [Oceanospirillales bacterium]